MARNISNILLAFATCATFGFAAPSAQAQQQGQFTAPEDSFASENAVLDTSILFAIGAHEARQELRGAFGWPTFQEGLVEGVYFRFDPDGYARFSPTPRLDTDVFEVICRPRTFICMGRKGPIQVTLTNRGQMQLQIEGVVEADTFALAEGIDEIPLPRTILQPLESRAETLLGSGGELIVRRRNNEISRTSLAGLFAVTTYLRWVAAQQDYTVLPRGWPVPNSGYGKSEPSLTQTQSWQSPMPQPSAIAPANQRMQPAFSGVQTEVAEVRGELSVLREMLMDRQTGTSQQRTTGSEFPATGSAARIAELQGIADELLQEIARLQGPGAPAAQMPAPAAGTLQVPTISAGMTAPVSPPMPMQQSGGDTSRLARQLEYLMSEIGLAPDVALMVVQHANAASDPTYKEASAQNHDQVIENILEELRTQVTSPDTTVPTPVSQPENPQDFQILSDYFQSVAAQQ